MAKKLTRTPIPTPDLNLFTGELVLDAETIAELNKAIKTRKTPFIDDITRAEDIKDADRFRYAAQRRGTKKEAGKGIEGALRRAAIGRAATYRILELSLMHGVKAVEDLESLKTVRRAIARGDRAPYEAARRAGDAAEDLAHGIQRQKFFGTPSGKALPWIVLQRAQIIRDTQSVEDLPFIGVVSNDALSKRDFWSGYYREVQAASGQVIKAERVLDLFPNPAHVERLLNVHIPLVLPGNEQIAI